MNRCASGVVMEHSYAPYLIDWERVEQFTDVRVIHIEDNFLVTGYESKVLTFTLAKDGGII